MRGCFAPKSFLGIIGRTFTATDLTTAVRVRGQIVTVGVHKVPAPIDLRDVCFKELDMVGVRVYTSDDFQAAVDFVNAGTLGLEKFPVKSYSLDEVSAAFDVAASGADALKVLVTPAGNSATLTDHAESGSEDLEVLDGKRAVLDGKEDK